MAYENDGTIGHVLTVTNADGAKAPARSTIYGDHEQTQVLANCLTAKAEAYGVAGIMPIDDVPIPGDYSVPHHALDDECERYPLDRS